MAQYTVKSGDSWARIAGIVYNDQRRLIDLANANGGTGRVLHPGEVIELPDLDLSTPAQISQGDWNDITGANNFGGGGGGYSGRPPTPQIGSPTQPRPTATTTAPPTPIVRPFTSVGSQRRQDELPATRTGNRPVGVGGTRQGNINAQRQQALASNQRGANLNAMALAYGRQPGQRQTSTSVTPTTTTTPTTAANNHAALRQAVPYLFGPPRVERNQLQNALPYLFPVGQGQGQANRNTAWNPANNRANTRVQTVPQTATVSYGTEGSPLTQAQFNRGAQYTGEAFQHYITSPEHDRKKLPRFMTTDLARVMPFPKRAGVTTEDWLRGMGYEEFRPGVWRIMEPVSKYATGGRGRYSGGGGGTYTEGGGGGGRRGGGGGGGGYYNQARSLGLTNWRIGIG